MKLAFWRRDKPETRSTGSGYSAQLLQLRESYLSGTSGVAELTAVVQAAVTHWESGLGLAEVTGTDLLTPEVLSITARSLALRGESVWYVTELGLVAASDWDLSTRGGKARAYRLSIPEIGGGSTLTALSAEVLHFKIGADAGMPWAGTSPLRRASITADLLATVESGLAEAFDFMPLGSQIVSFPEAGESDLQKLGAQFRRKRGRVLLQESTAVHAAGGPQPTADWTPRNLTPDLSKSLSTETLAAARDSIAMAYGILPAMLNPAATGPLIREAQRHLAQWMLQPIVQLIAAEAGAKLGGTVEIDVMRPLQAYDAGGRARAAATVVQLLVQAKEAGIDSEHALSLVNWEE